ncbi:hypothetical protein L208DRAFT_766212 [Tricholoma matsutake]|nr:hypothetical protein L208DRAFT_766212 [Tricholoma matsutake 945]
MKVITFLLTALFAGNGVVLGAWVSLNPSCHPELPECIGTDTLYYELSTGCFACRSPPGTSSGSGNSIPDKISEMRLRERSYLSSFLSYVLEATLRPMETGWTLFCLLISYDTND